MDYEKAYKKALERARNVHKYSSDIAEIKRMEYIFSELAESEDDKIRNFISNELTCLRATTGKGSNRYEELTNAIAWLEKQGEKKPILDFNADDWYVSKVDGKIYNAKFIEQDSYKKIRRKEIEKAAFSTSGIIEQTDWFIKGAEWADEHPCCNWLEKQGTPKQVSIWKHWKDGIAGNGEGKPIYLVKIGNTYSLKSCLGFECDYIELSELDNLMLEKQGEQTDKIVERAKTEKQRVLITESDGEANIDWDTRSLQDVKLLLEYGLDYINKLDEKNCLSNTKPSMGDLKIISSLKDIIYGYWNSLPDSALEENEVAESCYRWLEKQCEQNLVNKVEPKFHKGDWVVFNNRHDSVYQVEKIENYEYTLRHFLGGSMLLSFSHEDMIRAWTIQDAKDGDVLKEDSCIFIIKRMKPNGTAIIHCCLFDDDDFDLSSTLSFDIDSTHPATIEQRDILFAKMHETGYMWDSKSKQLLSLKAEPSDIQTPTGWSEEDESMYTRTLGVLGKCYMGQLPTKVEEELKWFKSLKQRIGG